MKLLFNRWLFVLSVFVVLLGSGLAYMYITADPPGYCRAQQRYISDEEFQRAAAAVFNWDINQETIDVETGKKVKRKENWNGPGKDLDFDPNNPNCCLVGRGYPHSLQFLLRRMFNLQEVYVLLNTQTSTSPFTGDNYYVYKYNVCGQFIGIEGGGHNIKHTTTNYLEVINQK